ncbi:DUF4142 domain-containing protein [Dyadobacter sp. Leaf189]|uniref:DUF4142 domain-containing protein n=1 Tax=Dyadobacter sp. Leaf189 TaxID=1736295 RepID=UPI0006F4344F|nr:DUF4142 domain-containing protein [Dyadobacter sp. Leaf189]KQS31118.1 hypothetical protein ASG33_12275 [Dyadobacter sp. Leaf189]
MKKPRLYFLLLLTLTLSCSDDDDENARRISITEDDRAFVLAAADEGLFQISAGQLALENQASKDYADFAQLMIDGYTKSNDELKAFAADKDLTIPNTISDERQQALDSLASRKMVAFDTTYAATMVAMHTNTISFFEAQAGTVSDNALKSWINGKIPVLRSYLEQAKALSKSPQ